MMNRKSNFTLIELIVVIVVLGILAAIVIPNISSFQKEAREAQLTADARNIQTALDMYRAKSESGIAEPVLLGTDKAPVTFKAVDEKTVEQTLIAVDMSELSPKFLRKTPKYVQNEALLGTTATPKVAGGDQAGLIVKEKVDYTKGQVVVGLLTDANGSTAVVQFASFADGAAKIVR